jgi:hypothetical protein
MARRLGVAPGTLAKSSLRLSCARPLVTMGAYSIRDAGIVKQRAIVLRACRLHSPAWRTTSQEMRRPRGSVKVPLKPVHASALPACRPSRFVVSLGRRDDHRCVGKALLLTDTTLALPGAFAISSGGGDVGTFHPASASWLILSYIVPLRSTGFFCAAGPSGSAPKKTQS